MVAVRAVSHGCALGCRCLAKSLARVRAAYFRHEYFLLPPRFRQPSLTRSSAPPAAKYGTLGPWGT